MPLINWDEYFAKAKWDEIHNKSPFLSNRRLPSLVLENEGIAYLSSLDLDCHITDVNFSLRMMKEIKSSFHEHLGRKDYFKAAVAEADFYMLQQLLSNQGEGSLTSLEDEDE